MTQPSITRKCFVAGFIVATLKVLVSGMTFKGFTMAPFSGGDFAAMVGALGAVYAMRRHSDKNSSNGKTD